MKEQCTRRCSPYSVTPANNDHAVGGYNQQCFGDITNLDDKKIISTFSIKNTSIMQFICQWFCDLIDYCCSHYHQQL